MNEELKAKTSDVLKKIGAFMGLDFRIEYREPSAENEASLISVYTDQSASFLIGRNGNNLQALEHLVRALMVKEHKEPVNVSVDVNDYRKYRNSMVLDTARQAVTRVRNTQKAEALLPMSSYERKIIHTELASFPDIITESIGEGAQRRIVIKPYP